MNKGKYKLMIRPKYSGKESKEFWHIVSSLETESDRQEVYSLGVALQNMEQYVLKQLGNAINTNNILKFQESQEKQTKE